MYSYNFSDQQQDQIFCRNPLTVSEAVANFIRSPRFDRLPRVDIRQVEFAKKIGIDIDGYPKIFAYLLIESFVNFTFDKMDNRNPTDKQINFVAGFGVNVSHEYRVIVDALIETLMLVLNLEAIEREQLKPGVQVINIYDSYRNTLIISSISEDGTVYFRGGNGRRAWARSLKRIKELDEGIQS